MGIFLMQRNFILLHWDGDLFLSWTKVSLLIMCAFLNALERSMDHHSGGVTAKQLMIRI